MSVEFPRAQFRPWRRERRLALDARFRDWLGCVGEDAAR